MLGREKKEHGGFGGWVVGRGAYGFVGSRVVGVCNVARGVFQRCLGAVTQGNTREGRIGGIYSGGI